MKINKINRVGVIAMFNMNTGGGAPRVTIDLINSLNELGKKVFLLTPFELDYKIIGEFYGKFKIEKIYCLEKIKSLMARGRALPRKLMKNEFLEMCYDVELIIDIDGGIFEDYLPENFKSRYIIWRISAIKPESEKPWIKRSFKRNVKEAIQNFLGDRECIPSNKYKIYAVDKWTANELKEYKNLDCDKVYLYPQINTNKLILKIKKGKKNNQKKNQIVIFGRIAPNKSVDDSIKIFAYGTKNFPNYKLVIMGGSTADTEEYLERLKNLINELNISDRVEIIENPSFERLKKILQESKVIIDSQKEINLTMTSIEAMAAGNIVLGYKNSGGYLDILENGKYGFGFLTVEEGAIELENILKKLEKDKININKSIKRSKDFSKEKFKERLKIILKATEKEDQNKKLTEKRKEWVSESGSTGSTSNSDINNKENRAKKGKKEKRFNKDYVKYYDLFNKDKNYTKEVDFLEQVFNKFSNKNKIKKILDLGCGTGLHTKELIKRGYEVVGLDLSKEMIEIAKQRNPSTNFYVSDMSNFNIYDKENSGNEKFDAIICMFSVLGYLTENSQLENFFKSCKNHLKENGLLILDVWNGLGVMNELPSSREKIVEVSDSDKTLKIIRKSFPELDSRNHINNVKFVVKVFEKVENENESFGNVIKNEGGEVKSGKNKFISRNLIDAINKNEEEINNNNEKNNENKNWKLIKEYEENHKVRFFFPQEIKKYLGGAGFSLIHLCPSFEIDKELDEKNWNMIVVGRG